MNKILIAPRKYVQGKHVMKDAGSLIRPIGRKVMVLWDDQVKSIVGETLLDSLKAAEVEVVDVLFNGDCTRAEAARVAAIASENKVEGCRNLLLAGCS